MNANSDGEVMLEIHEEPYGEDQASAEVSDNPNDIRNAVYSRAAARERRIQIIMYASDNVSIEEEIKKTTEITFSNDFIDFGQVTFGDQVSTELVITNIGQNKLLITNIEPSCGCTIFELPEGAVKPGDSVKITVFFDAHDTLGEQNEFLTITLNTEKGMETLFIGAYVIEK